MDQNRRQSIASLVEHKLKSDGASVHIFKEAEKGDVIGYDRAGKYIAVKLGAENRFAKTKNGVTLIAASSYENFLSLYLTGSMPKVEPAKTLF